MHRFKNTFAWMLAIILVASFSIPFFRGDFFLMHDYTHIARLAEMRLALEAGHLPVHWSQNLGYGYGMPLFLFYGPLPFYLGTILSYFGIGFVGVTKLLFLLSGVLAFGGMYALLQRWGRSAAFVGATLLLAAPYRAVDIFIRGALNEVLAIGILPWILHAGFAVKERKSWAVPLLALSTAALVMTHNLTAMVSLPLLGLLSLIWILTRRSRTWMREVLELALGYVWGGLLSLWYIVPAFAEKGATAIGTILSGYFDYHLHFLYIRQLLFERWGYGGSEYGPNDGISFHLSWVAIGLAFLSGAVLLWRWWLIHREEKNPSFLVRLRVLHQKLPARAWMIPVSGIFLALTLFLTLERSVLAWESLPLISFLQFPWRMLGVAITCLSLLVGLGISLIKPFSWRWGVTALALLCILPLTRFHRPETYLPEADGHFSSDPAEIRGNVSSVLPDYIPTGFNQKLPPVATHQRITIATGQELRWETNKPHQLIATVETPAPTTVTWNIADFAGWKYFINEKEVSPVLTTDGLRTFVSEEPVTSVGAVFTLTTIRQWTLVVSLAAALALVSTIYRRKHV